MYSFFYNNLTRPNPDSENTTSSNSTYNSTSLLSHGFLLLKQYGREQRIDSEYMPTVALFAKDNTPINTEAEFKDPTVYR